MSLLAKARTLARLVWRGQFGKISIRLRYNIRKKAVSTCAGPFAYKYGRDRMICDPLLHDSAALYVEPETDCQERDVIRAWLGAGDFVIDAGANVGLYSFVSASCVGAGGVVAAIEPTPRLATHIKRCAALLGYTSVSVHQIALGGNSGVGEFAFASSDDSAVSQSLIGSAMPPGTSELGLVKVRTLAETAALAGAHMMPSLIKMDIEGAEAQVLLNVPRGWLGADGPLWIVECNPDALSRFGASAEQIFEAFDVANFDVWIVAKYSGLNGTDLAAVPLKRAQIPPASFHNLIAVPRGKSHRRRHVKLARVLTDSRLPNDARRAA